MSLAGLAELLPLVLYILTFGIVASLYVFSVVWSFFDARSRGRSGVLASALVALLMWPLGFIAWLLFRPAKQSAPDLKLIWTRQFSAATCVLAIALLMIAVGYVWQKEYEVIALVRVQPDVDGQLTVFEGYETKKKSFSASLVSKENIATAVRNATGVENPKLIATFSERLELNYPGNSEILSVAVRGRRLNNDQSMHVDILNELMRLHLSASTYDGVALIQNAVVVASN